MTTRRAPLLLAAAVAPLKWSLLALLLLLLVTCCEHAAAARNDDDDGGGGGGGGGDGGKGGKDRSAARRKARRERQRVVRRREVKEERRRRTARFGLLEATLDDIVRQREEEEAAAATGSDPAAAAASAERLATLHRAAQKAHELLANEKRAVDTAAARSRRVPPLPKKEKKASSTAGATKEEEEAAAKAKEGGKGEASLMERVEAELKKTLDGAFDGVKGVDVKMLQGAGAGGDGGAVDGEGDGMRVEIDFDNLLGEGGGGSADLRRLVDLLGRMGEAGREHGAVMDVKVQADGGGGGGSVGAGVAGLDRALAAILQREADQALKGEKKGGEEGDGGTADEEEEKKKTAPSSEEGWNAPPQIPEDDAARGAADDDADDDGWQGNPYAPGWKSNSRQHWRDKEKAEDRLVEEEEQIAREEAEEEARAEERKDAAASDDEDDDDDGDGGEGEGGSGSSGGRRHVDIDMKLFTRPKSDDKMRRGLGFVVDGKDVLAFAWGIGRASLKNEAVARKWDIMEDRQFFVEDYPSLRRMFEGHGGDFFHVDETKNPSRRAAQATLKDLKAAPLPQAAAAAAGAASGAAGGGGTAEARTPLTLFFAVPNGAGAGKPLDVYFEGFRGGGGEGAEVEGGEVYTGRLESGEFEYTGPVLLREAVGASAAAAAAAAAVVRPNPLFPWLYRAAASTTPLPLPHGRGVLTSARAEYRGSFVNGLPHGGGTLEVFTVDAAPSNCTYDGPFVRGLYDTTGSSAAGVVGRLRCERGGSYTGDLALWNGGEETYEGGFRAGEYHGHGVARGVTAAANEDGVPAACRLEATYAAGAAAAVKRFACSTGEAGGETDVLAARAWGRVAEAETLFFRERAGAAADGEVEDLRVVFTGTLRTPVVTRQTAPFLDVGAEEPTGTCVIEAVDDASSTILLRYSGECSGGYGTGAGSVAAPGGFVLRSKTFRNLVALPGEVSVEVFADAAWGRAAFTGELLRPMTFFADEAAAPPAALPPPPLATPSFVLPEIAAGTGSVTVAVPPLLPAAVAAAAKGLLPPTGLAALRGTARYHTRLQGREAAAAARAAHGSLDGEEEGDGGAAAAEVETTYTGVLRGGLPHGGGGVFEAATPLLEQQEETPPGHRLDTVMASFHRGVPQGAVEVRSERVLLGGGGVGGEEREEEEEEEEEEAEEKAARRRADALSLRSAAVKVSYSGGAPNGWGTVSPFADGAPRRTVFYRRGTIVEEKKGGGVEEQAMRQQAPVPPGTEAEDGSWEAYLLDMSQALQMFASNLLFAFVLATETVIEGLEPAFRELAVSEAGEVHLALLCVIATFLVHFAFVQRQRQQQQPQQQL